MIHMLDCENLKYDVVIVGGGISGIACAYIASKYGLSTLLIEERAFLGGLMTAGLVIPMMKTASNGLNVEFLEDLREFGQKYNAQIEYGDGNKNWYNPILMKKIFALMLKSVGCDVLLKSKILEAKKNDKKIDEIFVMENFSCKNKEIMLSLHIYSKHYVDATGDGNFAKILKCNFYKKNNKKQSDTLRFIAKDIDMNAFRKFLMKHSDEGTSIFKVGNDIHLSCAYTWDSGKKWAMKPLFDEAVRYNILKEADTAYFQLFTIPFMPNCVVFNCPKVIDGNIKGAKEAIFRFMRFLRRYFTGFEKVNLYKIADMVGKRGADCPKTLYEYTIEDIKTAKRFKNEVLCSDYPVDIHSDKKNGSKFKAFEAYYLPLEALCSFDYDNLFIVGKQVGADIYTQGALRIQPTCASMGEAVAKHIKSKI